MDTPHISAAMNPLLLQGYAEAVRSACIEAALSGYERALISGLCQEGAFEAAISAVRMVDLDSLSIKNL